MIHVRVENNAGGGMSTDEGGHHTEASAEYIEPVHPSVLKFVVNGQSSFDIDLARNPYTGKPAKLSVEYSYEFEGPLKHFKFEPTLVDKHAFSGLIVNVEGGGSRVEYRDKSFSEPLDFANPAGLDGRPEPLKMDACRLYDDQDIKISFECTPDLIPLGPK